LDVDFINALSGYGILSQSNAPIDCKLVKAQGSWVSVDEVEACHGPESPGNEFAGMIPLELPIKMDTTKVSLLLFSGERHR
jgi:hypothetical protein